MILDENVNRYYLTETKFKAIRESLRRSGEFFFTGSASIFSPKLKTKWLIRDRCISWHHELLTSGEIAKYELKTAFPDIKRVGWLPRSMRLLGMKFPMFCKDEYRGDFVHVDISGAYWQCYQNLWLDSAFPCGLGGQFDLAPVALQLQNCKPARNALIGLTRSTRTLAVKDQKSFSMKSHNKFLSPHLWATVQTWLNEICYRALSWGAVYCMVDGYFFPYNSEWYNFLVWLDDKTISYRRGDYTGHIRGWLSYSMQDWKTTKPYLSGGRGRVAHCKLYAGEPDKIVNWWSRDIPNYRLARYGNG